MKRVRVHSSRRAEDATKIVDCIQVLVECNVLRLFPQNYAPGALGERKALALLLACATTKVALAPQRNCASHVVNDQ